MAQLYFSKKDYEKALLYLNKIQNKESEFYKSYKFLLAKVFFEQNNFELAGSNLASLKKYVKSNRKLPGYVKDQINIFVKYFTQLLRIKTNGGKNKDVKIIALRKNLEKER